MAAGDRERMGDQIEALAAHVRAADAHPEVPVGDAAKNDELLLPGEAEHRTAEANAAEGIPLPERVVEQLTTLAAEFDVADPLGE